MAILPVGIGPQEGGYQIERSLRFNSADSAYLSKTPASAGNRKTWTWSGWRKLSSLTTGLIGILSARSDDNNRTTFLLNSNAFLFQNVIGGSFTTYTGSAVFRDPSAWYHFVLAVDTTQATGSNRVKIYVNGVQQTLSGGTISQNADTWVNNTNSHSIGRNEYSTPDGYFNGYATEDILIDGQALDPTSFGEYNSETGVWQPKAYTGSYGTNGFYLPFSGTDPFYSAYFDGSGDEVTGSLPSGALGTGDFTVEYWMYNTSLYNFITAFSTTRGSNGFNVGTDAAGLVVWYSGGARQIAAGSVQANRWNHFAYVRSGSTLTAYLNGTSVGSATVTTDFSATSFAIGSLVGQNTEYVTGYMSNVRIVVGSAVYTSNFTVPTSPLTNVTNTKLLTLKSSTIVDTSSSPLTLTVVGNTFVSQNSPPFASNGIASDFSGNNNNWSPFNLSVTAGAGNDSLVDTPTPYGTDTGVGAEVRGNYATLNPLDKGGGVTLTNGNLDYSVSNGAVDSVRATMGISSGKWYWEGQKTSTDQEIFGIANASASTGTYLGGDANGWGFGTSGNKYNNNTATSYGSSCSTTDIVGVAFDADNGTLTFYKNGVSLGTAFSGLTTGVTYFPAAGSNNSAGIVNFGQRPFAYTAPSGFKALCTQNLPEPTVVDGGEYFDVSLYAGTDTTNNITGLAYQPDWVWIKNRTSVQNHLLVDVVRGSNKSLQSSTTNAEGTITDGRFTSFNSNGFTVASSDLATNASSNNYVAWSWKAGGTGVSNTAGSITSTVSANTTAGFSIVTYTGDSSANQTVGHGLGVTPEFIIVKVRGTTGDWVTYNKPLGADRFLILNATNAQSGSVADYWGTPSSTTFGIKGGGWSNNFNGQSHVAYCFAPVAGYSAFGSYTGNGSSDGPFVYTNHRPRYLMVKRVDSTGSWFIFDTARDSYNQVTLRLEANTSNSEASVDTPYDLVSNGFKLRGTNAQLNASGGTYIYAAFAENPFKFSLAR